MHCIEMNTSTVRISKKMKGALRQNKIWGSIEDVKLVEYLLDLVNYGY